jgi:hypothetical protein
MLQRRRRRRQQNSKAAAQKVFVTGGGGGGGGRGGFGTSVAGSGSDLLVGEKGRKDCLPLCLVLLFLLRGRRRRGRPRDIKVLLN